MTPERTESVSGTSLQTMSRHCLHALDHRDNDTLRDERYFAAGTTAHAVLEAFHRWTLAHPNIEMSPSARDEIAHKVVLHLASEHPGYRGKPSPPLPLDRVQEGRDIAVIWSISHPVFKGEPEVAIACDSNWRVTTDRQLTAYRGILDSRDYEDGVEIDPDDGITANILTIDDYKTAWHTSEEECDSKQQRFYGLLALALYPQTTLLIRRIHNLRTGQTFERPLWIDSAGEATIDRWRREVEEARAVASIRGPDGNRPATPGAGCVGCPWVRSCKPAASILEDVDPTTMAIRFAVTRATVESLAEQVKQACEHGAIPVPGGTVGYKHVTSNVFGKDGATNTVAAWDRANDPAVDTTDALWLAKSASTRALIDALKPGSTALKALSLKLYPRATGKGARAKMDEIKESRRIFLESVLSPVGKSAFGVHPATGPDGNEDRPLLPSETNPEESE